MPAKPSSTYQKRIKPTRTKLFRRIWSALEAAERPDTLGWLNRFRVQIDPACHAILQAAGLDSVHGVFHTGLGETVSQDCKLENDDVLRVELAQQGEIRTFYLKRYWSRDFNKIWRRAFRGSLFGPALVEREASNIEQLGSYGVSTPKVAAFGCQRFCGGVVNSFIITEAIPDAMGLNELIGSWIRRQPQQSQQRYKEALLAEVARNLRLMHGHGFEHHDLYLRNLMVSGLDMGRLYIFDCPRAHHWPQFLMHFRRVHDLATLGAGSPAFLRSTQRMRFMHIYLGRKRLSPADKSLVRSVLKRAEPMRERQIARLRREFPPSS